MSIQENGESDHPQKRSTIGSLGTLPVHFGSIPKTLVSPFTELFPAYKGKGMVRGEPGGFTFSPEYGKHAENLFRFQPRRDDVWLTSFPRSGTTWTQEMIWMIMNDCDSTKAAKASLFDRCPYLEHEYETTLENYPPESRHVLKLQVREKMPSPRIIQTHLPFYLLHPDLLETSKIIYVARNPKDVIVSYFYLCKLYKVVHDYQGTLEQFADYFMNNEVFYAPYFPHVLDAWSKRTHPNLLFLFYEDRKKDLRGEIEKVSTFLERPLSERQMSTLLDHLHFDSFAKNKSVNWDSGKETGILNASPNLNFIRRGKTGDWKNHFTPELNHRIDQWIEKNLEGTDLKFVTELDYQD